MPTDQCGPNVPTALSTVLCVACLVNTQSASEFVYPERLEAEPGFLTKAPAAVLRRWLTLEPMETSR